MAFPGNTKALTSAKFYAQRLLGIRKQVSFSSPSSATRQVMSASDEVLASPGEPSSKSPELASLSGIRTEFRSFTESALSEGWYMLEASGRLKTIGANVTLRGLVPGNDEEIWSDLAHVQLGSHKETKRLLRLVGDVEEICVLVDGIVDFTDAPSIVLIRVTESFAVDRMFKKIRYTSSSSNSNAIYTASNSSHGQRKLDSGASAMMLYSSYQDLMERHVKPVSYSTWLDTHREYTTQSLPTEHHPAIIDATVDDELEYEATIDIDRAEMSGLVAGSISGRKPSGLMGNPSLTLFIADCPGSIAAVDNIYQSLYRLLENIQCDLTVVAPVTISDQRLHELSGSFASIIEIVYFESTDDCALLDELFNDRVSDLQVFVSGDTLLDVDCLLRLYKAIRHNSGVSLVYSDHDCVDEFGRRNSPVFKPEWNPELLMNGNYVGSVVMMARHLFKSSGGWQHRFENSAIYDLLLRAGDYLTPSAALRIPHVLWHARIVDARGSIFLANGWRAPQVLQDYLDGVKPSEQALTVDPGGQVFTVKSGLLANSLKVDCESPGLLPQVEILIPSKDKVDLLESCINSILRKTTYPLYTITIIDNGSDELGTLEYYTELEAHPSIKLLHYPGEFNYSALNNFAANKSTADVLVLLNNDTEVISPVWLDELVSHAKQPAVGCVGAKLYYSNDRIQHGGVVVGLKGMAGHAHRFLPRDADGYCGRLKLSQNISAVTAACLAVRREVYLEVGGLDEVNLKVAYNDVDFCLRVLQAGFRNVWTPYAELYHHESVSRGSEDTPQKKRRFQEEFAYMQQSWATDSWEDPAYNPNLAKDVEDFSLAT